MAGETKKLKITEVCTEETVYVYTIEVPEDFPSDWNEMTDDQKSEVHEQIMYTDGYQVDSMVTESTIDNVEEA